MPQILILTAVPHAWACNAPSALTVPHSSMVPLPLLSAEPGYAAQPLLSAGFDVWSPAASSVGGANQHVTVWWPQPDAPVRALSQTLITFRFQPLVLVIFDPT